MTGWHLPLSNNCGEISTLRHSWTATLQQPETKFKQHYMNSIHISSLVAVPFYKPCPGVVCWNFPTIWQGTSLRQARPCRDPSLSFQQMQVANMQFDNLKITRMRKESHLDLKKNGCCKVHTCVVFDIDEVLIVRNRTIFRKFEQTNQRLQQGRPEKMAIQATCYMHYL